MSYGFCPLSAPPHSMPHTVKQNFIVFWLVLASACLVCSTSSQCMRWRRKSNVWVEITSHPAQRDRVQLHGKKSFTDRQAGRQTSRRTGGRVLLLEADHLPVFSRRSRETSRRPVSPSTAPPVPGPWASPLPVRHTCPPPFIWPSTLTSTLTSTWPAACCSPLRLPHFTSFLHRKRRSVNAASCGLVWGAL